MMGTIIALNFDDNLQTFEINLKDKRERSILWKLFHNRTILHAPQSNNTDYYKLVEFVGSCFNINHNIKIVLKHDCI